ncbi:kynurenine-oxoglutarate transaminase [Plasmopara halstedii]|uniref:Kynurenine-oxoglutarate transaminase n=1 Tax=Plasmopara halstedii TaxID=4781 RepID=A0A0P1B0W0_PLAHL|nr:kynurenine-oxoglutarate transaminase [Plasmopara halstedii]CEG47831.1 kynurenine-oxoglutarate transaminase [Plasmopara halstedii]|eukprot:XP_024584200.1 kynurenine-oxoglutarate transaminase [Plasmopara halstedii]
MADELAKRLDGFDQPTVWHEFTPLALENGAVNLGQGFPDWCCENFVKQAAKDALDADYNQYARPQGHRKLVEQLAKKYSRELNRDINWENEVAVGVGATETIYAAVNSFVQAGDEVIIFEPSFDIYSAQVKMAGGVCRYIPLQVRLCDKTGSKGFFINEQMLTATFSAKTRAVILNTPHNPTGKVFTTEELELIANYVRQHSRVIVISDEVYEHILFDSQKHRRIASIDGMWDRTLTVSSAGKTFSVTGWKVGWAIGPSNLIKGIYLANNWIHFSVATPFQEAVANMLELAEKPYNGFPTFYAFVANRYEQKRDRLSRALVDIGIIPITPGGGIFLYSDISAVKVPDSFLESNLSHDWAFCRWLTISKGVAAIPSSAFFCSENKTEGSNWVRFAYCKTDEAIEEAIKRLSVIH